MRYLLLSFLLLADPAWAADCPRIVSQSPYITRALDWLGLERCIVGVSRYDPLDRPKTGGVIDPDVDTIALLEPQLMITSNWTQAATWQAAAQASGGAVALRVDGFRGMSGVEAMLRDIGRAAGIADIDTRVERFAADWRAAASRVHGQNRRVLVLSACGEAPYSFGRGTTLHEVFTAAGFAVVADHDSIRNFRPGQPDGDVAAWIRERQPEFIFALKNRRDEACNAAIAMPGVPILPLDGPLFTHPGPDLLKGLEQLRETLLEINKP
ncbi:MAG: ABC transporter substrate-binding protein [Pseudomonadota bacterium]